MARWKKQDNELIEKIIRRAALSDDGIDYEAVAEATGRSKAQIQQIAHRIGVAKVAAGSKRHEWENVGVTLMGTKIQRCKKCELRRTFNARTHPKYLTATGYRRLADMPNCKPKRVNDESTNRSSSEHQANVLCSARETTSTS